MRQPKLSVVVAVRNGEKTINECIESLRKSPKGDVEIVVVNDNSTDTTGEILDQLDGDDLKVIHSKVNLGRAKARNLAVANARYEWISILDADDICAEGRFLDFYSLLDSHKSLDVVSGSMAYLRSDGKMGKSEKLPTSKQEFDYIINMGYMPVPHGGLTFKKSVFSEVGGYRDFERAQDLDLVIRLKDYQWVFSSSIHYLYRRSLITNYEAFRTTELNRIEILKQNQIECGRQLPIQLRYLVRELRRFSRVWF
jgi:glycosyltransferase involved in cell wall biosynthesis